MHCWFVALYVMGEHPKSVFGGASRGPPSSHVSTDRSHVASVASANTILSCSEASQPRAFLAPLWDRISSPWSWKAEQLNQGEHKGRNSKGDGFLSVSACVGPWGVDWDLGLLESYLRIGFWRLGAEAAISIPQAWHVSAPQTRCKNRTTSLKRACGCRRLTPGSRYNPGS